jgi:acylaminoacyl-peptidase
VADPGRAAVVGGSHGGFLTGHLLGQAPHAWKAAVMRNPVTNIALMVGLSDISDWCFVEVGGHGGRGGVVRCGVSEAVLPGTWVACCWPGIT